MSLHIGWSEGQPASQREARRHRIDIILDEQLSRLKQCLLSQIDRELHETQTHSSQESSKPGPILPGQCAEPVSEPCDQPTLMQTVDVDSTSSTEEEVLQQPTVMFCKSSSNQRSFELAKCWTQKRRTVCDKGWSSKHLSVGINRDHPVRLPRLTTMSEFAAVSILSLWGKLCRETTTISPTSNLYMCFSWFSIAVLMYELFMLPLRIFDIPDRIALLILNVFAVSFWTFDWLLSFVVGYQLPDGETEMRLFAIASKYAKTWLVPDLIIVVADWLLVFFALSDEEGDSQGSMRGLLRVGRAMRYVRVLRLLRLRKLLSAYQMLEEFLNSEYFSICFTLLFNFLCMLYIGHYLGCLWYLLGTTVFEGEESWVPYYKINETSWEYKYLTSLHWSLTQFTPGSMHVQPRNVYERGFGVVVLCCGMIAFSSIVSSITAGANQLKAITNRYRIQRTVLRRFLKEKQISRALVSRITRYADVIIQPTLSKVDDADARLLSLLPQSLRLEVYAQMNESVVKQHPLFRLLSTRRSVFREICSPEILQLTMLSEGDELFRPGDVAKHMYFVRHGVLDYVLLSPSGVESEAAEVGPASWFCEPALWTDWVHQGYSRAKSDAVVLSVHSRGFQETLLQHRAEMWMAQAYGREFLRSMNEQAGFLTETELDDIQLSDLVQCETALKMIDEFAASARYED
eukprot:TRINITY_DN75378_c0_g1_i1.p1 TRINITY_DN75378_c0_g1~~TRINITY_DN75378_c0_g1_i1.p1  ORF type:complete len:687 (-),score=78.72 TRINITY_DN75378_c0_g1_i1:179-2239(-)